MHFANLGTRSNADVHYTELSNRATIKTSLVPYVFEYSSAENHMVIGFGYKNAQYGAQIWLCCGSIGPFKARKLTNGTWSSWS